MITLMHSLLPQKLSFSRPVTAGSKNERDAIRVVIFSDAGVDRNGVGTYYSDLVDHLSDCTGMAQLICGGEGGSGFASRWRLPLPGDYTQRVWLPHTRRVSSNLQRYAPDVVVAATPGPFGLLALHYARRMGIPLVCAFHTHLEALSGMYWTRFARRVNQQYLEYVNRRFFERAVSVVTNSPEMAEVARDLGGNNVKITGTPINRDILDNPPPPPRTGLRRILYAGRLAPEKNIEAIIHAARHIPDMEFVLAGDGPLRKQVHAAARKTPNLQCKGWLSRTELKSVIESVDLVVLPSRIESFGTVALETMARRRNVLVSPGCGIVSWPSLAESLFIMEPDESLYDALLRLRRMDISVMQQKAEDGYRAAREWNRWTINRWLSLFGEAAARPGMLCAER